MHCVYKITFIERERQNIYPCYYIGSKGNVDVRDGVMYRVGRKKPYWGSPSDKSYPEALKEPKKMEVLKYFEDYTECLSYERAVHIENDVIINPKYFNKNYAVEGTYSHPDYGSFKHNETGKTIRLPLDHAMVLNGTYVGSTKGVHQTEKCKEKKKRFGKDNHFYGKEHTTESKKKIVDGQNEWKTKNPEAYAEHIENVRAHMTRVSRGVPKSEDHKNKIGRKGMAMIKNIETGEVKRLYMTSDEYINRDKKLWKTPYQISCDNGTVPKVKCDHCGNMFNSAMHTRWHGDNCKMKPKDSSKLIDIIE
jgi:hypothetical protein